MANLSCGIVGLPNVGKSTLFNALTKAGAAVAAYPFCTIEPNVGVVPVHDARLDRLAELVNVTEVIHHTVEYVDVAGLVKDASKGAGRGNQFLENLRACDALVHVIRCFDDPDVAHVHGTIDPVADADAVALELILADLETVEHHVARLTKRATREPEAKAELAVFEKLQANLEQERPARALELNTAERQLAKPYRLLTDKAVLYAANIDESMLPDMTGPRVDALRALAAREGNGVIPICAKLEEELAGLDATDAAMFLADAGLTESGLQRLARATSKLLGLISYMTFNDSQVRAWTIPEKTTARDAAGVIHTDFAEHFIRAEVTAFEDFERAGGEKGAREAGLTRIEGRDYLVQDGDVVYFRIGP